MLSLSESFPEEEPPILATKCKEGSMLDEERHTVSLNHQNIVFYEHTHTSSMTLQGLFTAAETVQNHAVPQSTT